MSRGACNRAKPCAAGRHPAHFGDYKLAGASKAGRPALCCDVCGPGGKVKAQLAIDAQCAAAAEGRRRAYATPHSQFLHARAAGRKRAGMGDLIVHSDDDVYENHLSTDIDELAEQWVAESALDDGTGPTGGPPGGAPGGSGDVFDVLARYQALEGQSAAPRKRARPSAPPRGGGGGGARARLLAKVMRKK